MINKKKKYNCIICEKKTDCFNKLSEKELKLIDDNRLEVKYNKGEIICKQGGFAYNILHIPEGSAKLYIEHNDKKLILSLIDHNEMIGLHSLFYNNILEYSAACLENSFICSISSNIISTLAKQNNEFATSIISNLNRNSSQFFSRIISLTQKQLHGRLADAILHLSGEVYKSESFELKLSRKDIADFTGMSTESAIRILKEFHNDRIIDLDGKKLKINSFQILEKLSEIG